MIGSPKTLGVKKFFFSILVFLIATDLAILLNIPFIRQILGLLFLTILPGLLILQILKLNKQSTIETILYSVGLSIAFLMFIGLFINTLYPLLGISKPISISPLMITINIAILILCALSCKINKECLNLISVKIKATFFISGVVVAKYKDIFFGISESGHEIASHSLTHENHSITTKEELFENIGKSKQLIEDEIGDMALGFRVPQFRYFTFTLLIL